jgi:hypothetical protein
MVAVRGEPDRPRDYPSYAAGHASARSLGQRLQGRRRAVRARPRGALAARRAVPAGPAAGRSQTAHFARPARERCAAAARAGQRSARWGEGRAGEGAAPSRGRPDARERDRRTEAARQETARRGTGRLEGRLWAAALATVVGWLREAGRARAERRACCAGRRPGRARRAARDRPETRIAPACRRRPRFPRILLRSRRLTGGPGSPRARGPARGVRRGVRGARGAGARGARRRPGAPPGRDVGASCARVSRPWPGCPRAARRSSRPGCAG